MKQPVIFFVLLACILAGIIYWGMSSDPGAGQDGPLDEQMTLYWGDGCPHCKKVDEFIEANKIAEKVQFVKKETWKDRANAREIERRAKACDLDPKEIGVPFLYADGQCFIGEPGVEKVLAEKAGLDMSAVSSGTENTK